MRRIILTLMLLFPVLAYSQPSIYFESTTHDFGDVEEGAQLEHTFEFTNTGTEELVIESLVPS